MLLLRSLALLLLALVVGGSVHAQEGRHMGKRFLVVFPDTSKAFIGPFVSPLHEDAELIFFSNDTAHVTITAPGYAAELTVTPDSARTLWLLDPAAAAPKPFIDRPNVPVPDVFDIRSDRPISLTCYFVTRSGGEAFTPLPVESWGSEYYAMSLRTSVFQHVGFTGPMEEVPIADEAPSEIIVIASEDSTDVTIKATTPIAIDDVTATTDMTIRLNAGEAVLLESAEPWRLDTVTRDISGTGISSSKPVGVITGNTRTQGGAGANIVATATGNSGNNCAVEWLSPASSQGSTFVVRPITPVAPLVTEEIIRVYATTPGVTTISLSDGFPSQQITQGSFATFSYSQLPSKIATGSHPTPFAIRTDQPAQAMVISGSFDRVVEPTVVGEQTIETWSPAMSILPPREEWINSARFHAPRHPSYLDHYVIVVADSGSQLWLDGAPIAYEGSVPGAPFQHVRIPIAAGDHTIRCVRGRCGAIAYGIGNGVESFLPLKTRKRDDAPKSASAGRKAPNPLHPSTYSELMSIAYAYPVTGVAEEALPPDSLVIARADGCDSSVVTVARIGPGWTFVPYDIAVDTGSFNTDVAIVPMWDGSRAGYTIRFAPRDPNADAEGKITLTNAAGRQWEIPYSYKAHDAAVTPDPIELLDVTVNEERTLTITLTNQRTFDIAITSLTLKHGDAGFSLRDLGDVGRTLAPGEAITATLAFTGATRNAHYYDTLVVTTSCRTFYLPVHALTGPTPVPVITGKDWGPRIVGTDNDSLSMVMNVGSLPFTVREVAIDQNPSNAFSLIPPDWRSIPAVAPLESYPVGIRFHPPAVGPFVGRILLITTDNDTAHAELRGVGVIPRIDAGDLSLGVFCIDSLIDTAVVIRSSGTSPLTISSLTVNAGTEADVMIDMPSTFLPDTLAPGEELRIRLRITPKRVGAIGATITLHSDAFEGDSTIAIDGAIRRCATPRLVIDDHDFDSVLITLTKPGVVTLRNLGAGDATVQSMTLAGDTAAAFAIISPIPPFDIRDGESVEIHCTFTPRTVGLKTARIELATDAGPLTSNLRGVGRVIEVPALIRRDYHAQPGEERTIYVELKGRLDTLPVERLDITVAYRAELLDFLAAQPDSAPRHGWRYFGAPSLDTLHYAIDLNNAPPDTGALLTIRFLTRFSQLAQSELPFTIETGLPYLAIVESPGLFTRDPFCGLQERLFVFASHNFSLAQNVPNPLKGVGRIEFEIPFDNPTTLIVYDALGEEMMVLVDKALSAGAYTAYIQEGALPPGLYYYRLRSGEFTAIRKMIVE